MRAAVRAARRRGAVRVWTVVSHVPASMPRIALLAGTVSRTVSRTLPLPTRGRARTGRRYVAGRAGSVRQIVYTEWTLRRVTPNYCTTRRRRRRGRPRAPRGGASLAGPSSRGLRGAGPRGRRISKCDKSKATCPPPLPPVPWRSHAASSVATCTSNAGFMGLMATRAVARAPTLKRDLSFSRPAFCCYYPCFYVAAGLVGAGATGCLCSLRTFGLIAHD